MEKIVNQKETKCFQCCREIQVGEFIYTDNWNEDVVCVDCYKEFH